MWGCYDSTFRVVKQSYPLMICPYIRVYTNGNVYGKHKLEVSVSEKLYEKVFDNRFDESVTMEQIKETYQCFLDDTKQYVQSLLG